MNILMALDISFQLFVIPILDLDGRMINAVLSTQSSCSLQCFDRICGKNMSTHSYSLLE